MRDEIAGHALEAMKQYYTSEERMPPPYPDTIPESAVQVHCALRLQQSNWRVLTEVCWPPAVCTLAAAAQPARSALSGRCRIDLIAFSAEESSSLFAVEIKKNAEIGRLKRDIDRLSRLAAAWRPPGRCTGILLLYFSFRRKEQLELQLRGFSAAFSKHDPVCTEPCEFSDPLNRGIHVHCAVASCLALHH